MRVYNLNWTLASNNLNKGNQITVPLETKKIGFYFKKLSFSYTVAACNIIL